MYRLFTKCYQLWNLTSPTCSQLWSHFDIDLAYRCSWNHLRHLNSTAQQPALLSAFKTWCLISWCAHRLNVLSRVLKVVDACGCKNLAEVYLYSPNLRCMLFSNCALLQTLVRLLKLEALSPAYAFYLGGKLAVLEDAVMWLAGHLF